MNAPDSARQEPSSEAFRTEGVTCLPYFPSKLESQIYKEQLAKQPKTPEWTLAKTFEVRERPRMPFLLLEKVFEPRDVAVSL